MLVSNFRSQLIDSISLLAEQLHIEKIPQLVLDQVISANPWFTKYYVEQSLKGVRTWLNPDLIWDFVNRYDVEDSEPINVGIIAAGNLPLVGFHDVLISLLSGNIAWVKASHQDRVLMEWIREIWIKIVPLLENFFHVVPKLASCDFLIATGNNNSGRYFQTLFEGISRVIRKNRFSIAVLDDSVDDTQLELLCRDILLYNGLGCRNVSNILIHEGFDLNRLVNQLNAYKQNLLNPLYLERVLYEKSRRKVLKLSIISSENLLILPSDTLDYTAMGILRAVYTKNEDETGKKILSASQQIQCVVGRNVSFGQTQSPAIDTFADGIDTMKLLTESR